MMTEQTESSNRSFIIQNPNGVTPTKAKSKIKILIMEKDEENPYSQPEEMKLRSQIIGRSKSPNTRNETKNSANGDGLTKQEHPKEPEKQLSKGQFGLWTDPTMPTVYSMNSKNLRYILLDPPKKLGNNKYQILRPNKTLIYEGYLDENYNKVEKGRLYCSNGDIYEGLFQDDKKHGEGKLFFKFGGYYEGEFVNDEMEGLGQLFDKNGVQIYNGRFKKGFKDGWGIMLLNGNDWYVGDLSNDFRHGHGTLFLKNDCALEGNWESNRKHGEFKKYPRWYFDEKRTPTVDGIYEIIYFKQDLLTFSKPTRGKIQIISNDGTKKDAELPQAAIAKPIKEITFRFGIRITTEDMLTLEGSNPLGANIVNFYMKAIEAKYLENCAEGIWKGTQKKILFLDSDFFSELTADNIDAKEINYGKVEHRFKAYSTPQHTIFDEFDRILMIINKKGQHWLLAEIYCEHCNGEVTSISFNIYDSMANPTTDNPKEHPIMRHIVKFALAEINAKLNKKSEEYKHLEKLINEAKLTFMDVPQQRDLHNCGVFVSRFIQHLAAGKTKIEFEPRNMNAFRKEIANIIFGTYDNPLQLDRFEKLSSK